MAKIVFITDTHFGVKSDSHIFLDYFKKFYDEVFFPYLDEHNIKTVVHLGDIVDRRKFVNYVTLRRMRQDFIDPLFERGIDFHVAVGNHDIPYRNTNEVNALGELFHHSERVKIYDRPRTIEVEGLRILIVPWINASTREDTETAIEYTDAKIAAGHLEIVGAEMGNGIVASHGAPAAMFSQFEKVFSGHFHKRTKIANIEYIGNPYQIYWNDFGDYRGFTVLDSVTLETELIVNPFSIFHKIYYDDKNSSFEDILEQDFAQYKQTYVKVVVENKTNAYLFDQMLSRLYDAQPANVQIIDTDVIDTSEIENQVLSEAEDTLTIVRKYIESTKVSTVDNDKLMFLFQHLYHEAENLEQ